MTDMDAQRLKRHVEREIGLLKNEFAGSIPGDEVERICWSQLEQLRTTARFEDFLPLLVHRHSREILVAARDAELHQSA
jgi:hypothetical protein